METPQFLRRALFFVGFLVFFSTSRVAEAQLACPLVNASDSLEQLLDIRRSSFPKNFVFGASTSAYQVEGAAHEGGRSPSIWDTFSHTHGKVIGDDNGDVAVDQYHRYEQDIDLLKSLHMDASRFSISWSRVINHGVGPGLNLEGIGYYNRLIDALVSKGIQPYVTLYHWDLPQALDDSFGGWLSDEIVSHYAFFAEVCFAAFGDRVKHWITFNEPQEFTWQGYGLGTLAPGRTSDRTISPVGNSSTEPYIAAHNVLLSHAAAVDIYRRKFQQTQKGEIGITLDCEWAEPLTDSAGDAAASERHILFQLGWYLDPVFFGDYPVVMRAHVGDRLPQFTAEQKAMLSRSLDFIGLNHYTTRWVSTPPPSNDLDLSLGDYNKDQNVLRDNVRDGISIGPKAYMAELYIVPWGIEKLISWAWGRYRTPIFVTENGMDTKNDQLLGEAPPAGFLHDPARISFYHDYLSSVLVAISKGADIRGYFAWSLLDNFEWASGYSSRFGLFYIDYNTLVRYPKDSARWFTKFLDPGYEGANCHPQKSS